MQQIRRIIVPIDFQAHSAYQANVAMNMAKILNARVTFLHVLGQLSDISDFEPTTIKEVENNFFIHADKKMSDFIKKLNVGDVEVDGVVVSGNPADSIINFAKEKNADMIIIGTHGAKGIEKILLGSVAERVIKGADCLCLVFNPFKKKWRYEDSEQNYFQPDKFTI